MNHDGRDRHRHVADSYRFGDGSVESRGVFGGLWLLLFVSAFLVAGPWAGFHAVLLGGLGVLVLLRPSQVRIPVIWWGLAIAFVLASTAAFLPADWFYKPEWRSELESLGMNTGPHVVIQSRMAMESLALFAVTIFIGFWMAGHRLTPSQIRLWALVFTVGVACYAVIAKITQNLQPGFEITEGQIYGFFPNRNHSATYLAMGVICGLGCILQAMRDKRFVILALALAATAVCLWAIASWSISRAGIVLVCIGGLLWMLLLGKRYLGRHGLWAIALIAFVSVGLFLMTSTEVRERMTDTFAETNTTLEADAADDLLAVRSIPSATRKIDFRIFVYLDALGLIRDYPWTGIGAGQFHYVFPQYRKQTIFVNDSDAYHPESDWLWMAAEVGIPATLALLALVLVAFGKSLKDLLKGRDRAVRAGCLVAAMLVPIHGIFDVPGHRITLALSSVFLFVLSLHPPAEEISPAALRVWASRIFALCLLVASFFLIQAQWGGGAQPALTAAQSVSRQTTELYKEDLALKRKAASEGRIYQPAPADDLLMQALHLVRDETRLAPLDSGLLRLEIALALQFDDEYPLVEKAYSYELALDPTWVAIPLRQAASQIVLDHQKTRDLWQEAIRRADRIDALKPGTSVTREHTFQQIQQQAKGNPELETWTPSALPVLPPP